MQDMHDFLRRKHIVIEEGRVVEPDEYSEELDEWFESLSPEEALDIEIRSRLSSFKVQLETKSRSIFPKNKNNILYANNNIPSYAHYYEEPSETP